MPYVSVGFVTFYNVLEGNIALNSNIAAKQYNVYTLCIKPRNCKYKTPLTPLKKQRLLYVSVQFATFFNVLGCVIAPFPLNSCILKVHISWILNWLEQYACTIHRKIHHSFPYQLYILHCTCSIWHFPNNCSHEELQ